MPLYLIASSKSKLTKEDEAKLSFLQLCMLKIRGEFEHVELSFIQDGRSTSYWLTNATIYAAYGNKDYRSLKEKHKYIVWLKLNISREREIQIQTRCQDIARRKIRKMNSTKMLMCAFPFYDERVANYLLDLFDPERETNIDASLNNPNAAYCASIIGEVLDIPDYNHATPSDVVIYCQKHYGAVETEEPTVTKRKQDVCDEAGIPRSYLV
jgi:hypothetical protein